MRAFLYALFRLVVHAIRDSPLPLIRAGSWPTALWPTPASADHLRQLPVHARRDSDAGAAGGAAALGTAMARTVLRRTRRRSSPDGF